MLFFNMGYCKEKHNCIYSHNMEECKTNCILETCMKRHKKKCKNGEECYYYQKGTCEFNHLSENRLLNETNHLKEEIKLLRNKLEVKEEQEIEIFKQIKLNEIETIKQIDNNNTMCELNNKLTNKLIETNETNEKLFETNKKLKQELSEVKIKKNYEENITQKENDVKENDVEEMEIDKISVNIIKIIKASIKIDSTQEKIILSKVNNKKGQLLDTYKCKLCKITINNNKDIIKHYKTSHEHKCKICKYITYDQKNSNAHMKSSHEGANYTCNNCGDEESDQNNLEQHISNVHMMES